MSGGRCTTHSEIATDHLRALGYKTVACSDENGETYCSADDQRFRCVARNPGCSPAHVACERFYVEKPAP